MAGLVRQTEQAGTEERWPWRAGSLASGVVLLVALTLVQRTVGFVRSVLFCRWLDADQLGQWDMAYGFLVLAAPIVVLSLPGSFGRYVEHYRQRGQLRAFLGRVTLVTLLLAAGGVGLVVWGRDVVARMVFNDAGQADLVLWAAAGLGTIIAFHFLTSLFTALRQYAAVSGIQLGQSVVFAAASAALLILWEASARSVVAGFALACGVASLGGSAWLVRLWRRIPAAASPLAERSLWKKLVPFALWMWVTNWVSNLFEIADRFMLVHISHLPSAEALGLVGQYHSARIVPALLIGFAEMLAAVVIPHLASDWEAGQTERVSRRLHLVLKFFGLTALAGAVATLLAAPLLFGVAFQGKYPGGEAVLGWALASSIWTGLAALGHNYLWCAERSRTVTGLLAVGLAGNVILNLLLVPSLGLLGAVLATAASRLVALALVWFASCRLGMHWDRGLAVITALPLLLPFGVPLTLVVALAVLLGALPTARLFDNEERGRIAQAARRLWLQGRGALGLPRREVDTA